MSEEQDISGNDEFAPKSKSQLKREAEAAQALGEQIVGLTDKQLKKLELPADLRDAIIHARGIKAHGGRKRQLQYIGKLMRAMDLEPIKAQLVRLVEGHQEDVVKFHLAERWRDRLLNEGDTAASEFVLQFPGIDVQQLRQLVRQSEKEQSQNKPPKAKRQLFQFISSVLAERD